MAAAVKAVKTTFRSQLKKKINAMTVEQRRQESLEVAQKLLNHEWFQQSQKVSVYLSRDDEVDTTPLVKDILESGRWCFIPRYVGGWMDMLQLYSLDDLSTLPRTRWNIKQPADDDNSRPNALKCGGLDMILVPGLGFTPEGDRLGRGKGYYDRYLSQCESQGFAPKTIGLAFSVQVCKSIPVEPSDKKINLVLYPNGTVPKTIEN